LIGVILQEQSRLRGAADGGRSSALPPPHGLLLTKSAREKKVNICKIHLYKWEDYCNFLNE
jgi:hypothetical protein